MKNTYRLNTFLAAVAGLVFLGYLAEHAFAPAAILPPLDLMLVSGISLVALILEHYSGKPVERRSWPVTALLSALTFVLLPLAAGLMSGQELLRFALVSWAAFMVLTFLSPVRQARSHPCSLPGSCSWRFRAATAFSCDRSLSYPRNGIR